MSIEKLMEKQHECIICFELVDTHQNQRFNDCSHANRFHEECIINWINKCNHDNNIPVCPICRNELIQEEVKEWYVEVCSLSCIQQCICCCSFMMCFVISIII